MRMTKSSPIVTLVSSALQRKCIITTTTICVLSQDSTIQRTEITRFFSSKMVTTSTNLTRITTTIIILKCSILTTIILILKTRQHKISSFLQQAKNIFSAIILLARKEIITITLSTFMVKEGSHTFITVSQMIPITSKEPRKILQSSRT